MQKSRQLQIVGASLETTMQAMGIHLGWPYPEPEYIAIKSSGEAVFTDKAVARILAGKGGCPARYLYEPNGTSLFEAEWYRVTNFLLPPDATADARIRRLRG